MHCEQCQEHFTDYLEGSLPSGQREQMAAHLRECADCAAELTAFRQTVAALGTLPVASPPEHLLRRITQAVAAQPAPARVRVSWQRVGTVAAAATVLVGLWAVLFYQHPGSVTRRVQPALRVERPAPEAVEQVAPLAEAKEAPAEDRRAADAVRPASPPRDPAMLRAREATADRIHARRRDTPRTEPLQPAVRADLGESEAPSGPPPPGLAVPPAREQGPDEEMREGAAGQADLDVGGAFTAPGTRKTMAPGGYAGQAAPPEAGAKVIIVPPPLAERVVGRPVDVSVAIQPDADVEQAQVQVETQGSLRLAGDTPSIYRGPLKAAESKRLTFGIIAVESGAQELRVELSSELPGVAASIPVSIPGFERPPEHLTTQVFDNTPLEQAAAAISREADVRVVVAEAVGQEPVSADFSEGIPAEAALRILADSADCTLGVEGDNFRIYRPAPDDDGE